MKNRKIKKRIYELIGKEFCQNANSHLEIKDKLREEYNKLPRTEKLRYQPVLLVNLLTIFPRFNSDPNPANVHRLSQHQ